MDAPQQQPTEQPKPRIDLSLDDKPQQSPTKRGGNGVLIAIIVSAVLLLVAAGLAAWVFLGGAKAPETSQLPEDTSETKTIKSIAWVPPQSLPGTFTPRQQNKTDFLATYYYDAASKCGIVTRINGPETINATSAADAVTSTVKTEDGNITLTASTPSEEYALSDTDGKTYPFASFTTEQSVNAPGVAFQSQTGVTAYKQFGRQIASISVYCAAATWAASQQDMIGILKTFTVKVEV